jgi:hypothetical protein
MLSKLNYSPSRMSNKYEEKYSLPFHIIFRLTSYFVYYLSIIFPFRHGRRAWVICKACLASSSFEAIIAWDTNVQAPSTIKPTALDLRPLLVTVTGWYRTISPCTAAIF